MQSTEYTLFHIQARKTAVLWISDEVTSRVQMCAKRPEMGLKLLLLDDENIIGTSGNNIRRVVFWSRTSFHHAILPFLT